MAEAGYRVEQRETGTGPSRCSPHVPLPCALGISPSTLPRRHLSGILRCGPLTHRGRRGWGGDQEEVSLEPPPRLFFCPCEDFGWLPTHHGLSAPFPINPQTQNVVAILCPGLGEGDCGDGRKDFTFSHLDGEGTAGDGGAGEGDVHRVPLCFAIPVTN